jgi:nucleoside 2-deoxyribosyltransferase
MINNQPKYQKQLKKSNIYFAGAINKSDSTKYPNRVDPNHRVDKGMYIRTGHWTFEAKTSARSGKTLLDTKSVVSACLDQIKGADVLIAKITKANQTGTMNELGFAHASGKPIIMYFQDGDYDKSEYWFGFEMALSTVTSDLNQYFKIIPDLLKYQNAEGYMNAMKIEKSRFQKQL